VKQVGLTGATAAILALVAVLGISGILLIFARDAILSMAVFAIAAFFASIAGWRRWHRLAKSAIDTESTSIAEASDGYVEFYGLAKPNGETDLRDPLHNRPCIWFAVKSFEGKLEIPYDLEPSCKSIGLGRNRADCFKEATSKSKFVLSDASGQCLIDPAGMQLDIGPSDSFYDADSNSTHVTWRLEAGGPLALWGTYFRSSTTLVATQADARATILGEVRKPNDDRPLLASRKRPAEFERTASRKSMGHFSWVLLGVLVATALMVLLAI
jgi:hypothetical protein